MKNALKKDLKSFQWLTFFFFYFTITKIIEIESFLLIQLNILPLKSFDSLHFLTSVW